MQKHIFTKFCQDNEYGRRVEAQYPTVNGEGSEGCGWQLPLATLKRYFNQPPKVANHIAGPLPKENTFPLNSRK